MGRKAHVRWLVVGALALVAATLLVALFWPRPLLVETAEVRVGAIAETVADQGQARVRDAYVVAAPVSGRLDRISLKVGDRVVAGRTIVAYIHPASPDLLDPRVRAEREVASAAAAVAAATARRDSAQASLRHAQAALDRIMPLAAKGFAAQQAADDAEAESSTAGAALRQAQADITARRHDLAAARAALSGPEMEGGPGVAVRSPVSGYVTHVLQESERAVAMGAQLLEISDSREAEAQIEFLSQDAVRIRPGMEAEIYDWGGPGVIPARVRLVEPQGYTKISALGVEEQRALVMLQFTGRPEAWAALGPGYRVWGRVYLRRNSKAVLVPIGALVRDAGGWSVFKLAAGRARLAPVRIGAINDQDAEALAGVTPGETLVVFPSDQVHDGASVKARMAASR